MQEWIGWIGSALLIAGMFYTAHRKRVGFIIGGIGELLWVVKSAATYQPDLLFISVVFTILYGWSWFQWGRDVQDLPRRR